MYAKQLNKNSLKFLIIETLEKYKLYSEEAVELIFGTIAQESHLGKYRRQMVKNFDINKHAVSICQIEKSTFDWLKQVFVNRYPELRNIQFIDLVYNDEMAILFCRLRYLVDSEPIPYKLEDQAKYWKRVYNTIHGSGTPEQYISNYQKYS